MAIWFLLLLNEPLHAQFKAILSGETGYFDGSGFDISDRNHLAYRLDAQLNYKFTRQNNIWDLRIRARPRFYGLDDLTSIVKYSADGQYWNVSDKLNWGLSLSRHFYTYSNPGFDVDFDIFQLQGTLVWNYKRRSSLALSFGYFYRDLIASIRNDLDALVIEAKTIRSRSRFSLFSIGAYAERFFINNDRPVVFTQERIENSGWRAGPSVSYEFQRHFLLRLQYRYLNHQSRVSEDLDAEHWFRILWGKILSSRWTLFFLTDFYYRHGQETGDEIVYHTYTSLNTESSLYGKLEYQLDKRTALFVKIEYTRDDVQFQRLSLSSRQITLGAEFGR